MSGDKYVPFYHNGEYIGDLPKSYADYLKRMAAENEKQAEPEGFTEKTELPLTKQEFEVFRVKWTLTTALVRRDWTVIQRFIETEKKI